MKKVVKIAVVSLIGLLSGTVAAAQLSDPSSPRIVEDICDAAPLLCMVTTQGNGNGTMPPRPRSTN